MSNPLTSVCGYRKVKCDKLSAEMCFMLLIYKNGTLTIFHAITSLNLIQLPN